jgi:hypothetical protein
VNANEKALDRALGDRFEDRRGTGRQNRKTTAALLEAQHLGSKAIFFTHDHRSAESARMLLYKHGHGETAKFPILPVTAGLTQLRGRHGGVWFLDEWDHFSSSTQEQIVETALSNGVERVIVIGA